MLAYESGGWAVSQKRIMIPPEEVKMAEYKPRRENMTKQAWSSNTQLYNKRGTRQTNFSYRICQVILSSIPLLPLLPHVTLVTPCYPL